MYLRPSKDRGSANFGWLQSRHSFSFGQYYDPAHMGFSRLRVINDDTVAPGAGFGAHPHQDMEIITYVTEGVIKHRDSMGNEETIPAGDIQVMSAGTGVTHSEFNGSKTEPLKFFQIWIEPNEKGVPPNYEQMAVTVKDQLTPLVSATGENNTLKIHQDASISLLSLAEHDSLTLASGNRKTYIHMIDGEAELGDMQLSAGDGVGFDAKENMQIRANTDFRTLVFNLPK